MAEQDYTINSVKNALRILKLFGSAPKPELSLMEISNLSGMNKSSALRMLFTLRGEDFLKYNPETKKYSLGVVLYHLGSCVYNNIDLQRTAEPYLHALADQTNLIAHLGILDGDSLVIIEKVQPTRSMNAGVQTLSAVGGILPVHCTGIGRLFLAQRDDRELEAFLDGLEPEAYTDRTVTDKGRLRELVTGLRTQDYCVIDGEHEAFLKSISFPIRDHTGRMVAGVSVGGIAEYFESLDFPQLCATVGAAARSISADLGYSGNPANCGD